KTNLQLFSTFGRQIRVADQDRRERSAATAGGDRRVGPERGKGFWLLPRGSIGKTEPQRVHEPIVPERLLVHHPTRAQFRVVDKAEVLSKSAVVVGPNGPGYEDAILPIDLLLQV